MGTSLKRFFFTYKRILLLAYQIHPGFLILLTVNNLAWGLTNLPVVYINKALIDLVVSNIGNPNWRSVVQTIIFLIAARSVIDLFRSFLSKINFHVARSLGNLMSDRIDIILGEKLNSLDVPTVEDADFQDKYAKVRRQANNRMWGMLSSLQEMPSAVATVISGAIPIFQFNPLFILVTLITMVPDFLVNTRLARLDYQDTEKKIRLYRVLGWLGWIISETSQFYENKISANIRYVSQKIGGLQDEIFRNDLHMRTRRVKWRTLGEIPQFFTSWALNAYFFILALSGRITIGTAQLLYQSANNLANGTSMFMNNVAQIYENYLFVKDYAWFIELQPKNPPGTVPFPSKIVRGIEFDHVWFKYPGSKTWALQDISFAIKPKENIALVGENGAGKTTLLKLLLGFYRPAQGRIIVDGINIHDFDPALYWQQISALPQEFHLYPFSAKESIAFSDLSRLSDDQAIKHSAKKAEIDDYLTSLPRGYDTPLAKDLDGADPSGGQKQRIAIARTLFKNSQIVMLDEPTSNVDPKGEEEIFANILKTTRDVILILVSHRFSTVRRADKIIVLDSGSLVEEGTHDQLLKNKGLYAKLFTLQAKSYQ